MKKTSTRLATVGGIVLLGVFALVLAQNDARKRGGEPPQIEAFAPQEAIPIAMEESHDSWSTPNSGSKPLVVRGNNDQLTSYGGPPQSELRGPSTSMPLPTNADELIESSHVVLAGAGLPVEPPSAELPSTASPPSWLTGSEKPAGQPAASTGGSQAAPNLPSLPTFGSLPTANQSTANQSTANQSSPSRNNPLPSLASPTPALPPTLSSDAAGMSDVQRGALPATNMLPPAAVGSLPAMQSPPTAQLQQPPAIPTYGAPPSVAVGAPLAYPAPVSPSDNSPSNPNLGEAPRTPGVSAAHANANVPNATVRGNASAADGGPTATSRPASGFESPAAISRSSTLTSLVSNQPGNRYLDGSQNPNMLIQKRAPEEIQVGKPATFVIAVRNAGNATAHDVRVVDSVPQGSRFIDATPAATPDSQGFLTWSLGEMSAGDERTITLQIVPEVQGEVGSNALVYFAAQASVRTVATLPKLEIQLTSQSEMLIGSRQQLSVVVKNTGTGVARGVRLEADLPEAIKHDSGEAQLAASLGDLRPNEVQTIALDIAAVAPGLSSIAIRAVSDDAAPAEQLASVDILAPQLAASIEGPKLRYLERQATYQIKVTNTGTTAATNLDFVVQLPAGLKYNSANNRGSYDPSRHTVSWGLYELPANESAPMELTVLPVELGPQAISFTATGDLGLKAETKGTVVVDGLAELAYTIGQDNGTIETGSSSTYSVQITNVGNKADKDVQLAVQLPNHAKLLKVDAQVDYRVEGNQILFQAIPEMRNKDQYTYRFQVQYAQAGTQIVRAQLTSANWPVAVIKEEGTLVYNDQN